MLTYSTEYEGSDGQTYIKDFGSSLAKAREHARRVSRRRHDVICFVVADDGSERVGAEGYAYGRRESSDGKIAA